MKTYLFLTACVALTLAFSGCDYLREPETLSQKQTASAKPVLQPPPKPQTALPPVVAAPMRSAPQAKVKTAILLPLSGENAALGQAMLNAAQQAVFDVAGPDFELQPRDTAGQGGADLAAQAAVAGGARLIIGPVFATDVPAVKAVAQANNMMMLPLSTDASLADHGVYVMGLAPAPQVKRVVTYAAQRGAHNFAALVPSTPYGSLVGEAFRNAVEQNGGKITDIETFDPSAHDLKDRVKTLAAQRQNIDALFLPESENSLKSVADQLSASGFGPGQTHILGTGSWDIPDLGRQSPLLVGAWYAAPDPVLRRHFIASYIDAYGQEPPRLATLAYDATALAAVIAKHGGRYDEAAMTNPNGFAGLDGIFRLTPTGDVERAMTVSEVTLNGSQVVDPAPVSFVQMRR